MISQGAICVFSPLPGKEDQFATLKAWASLQSILKLRVRKDEQPKYLSIIFRQVEGKQSWVLNVAMESVHDCTDLISNNLKSIGVKSKKKTTTMNTLTEQEVSKAAIAMMDIEQIMDHIASYEEEIENDLSLSTIQTLTTLYQKAIEYYSAFDDIMFAQILNKMQSMLARDDI